MGDRRNGFTHESTHNESQEWYIPPTLFAALGLVFDLDPCGAPPPYRDFVPARSRYTVNENGLLQPWKGLVFMNPPYGSFTPRWMRRFLEHGNGVALVFARTDTRWFHEAAPHGILCFLRGRLRFIHPDGTEAGSPGAGSLLVALGGKAGRALVKSGLGFCCTGLDDHSTQGVLECSRRPTRSVLKTEPLYTQTDIEVRCLWCYDPPPRRSAARAGRP